MPSLLPQSGATPRAGFTIYTRYLGVFVVLFLIFHIPLPPGIHRNALMIGSLFIVFTNLLLHAWVRFSRRPALGLYIFLFMHLFPVMLGIFYTGLLTSPFLIFLATSMFNIYFANFKKDLTISYGLIMILFFAVLLILWYLDNHPVMPWDPGHFLAFILMTLFLQLFGFLNYAYHASRSNPLFKERARQESLLAARVRRAELGLSLSMIAHELRTPLTTLSLNVENFTRSARRFPRRARGQLRGALKSCRADIQHLKEMMESTLSYARERRGAYQMNPILLREIINQADHFHRLKYGTRGGHIDIDPAFPDRAQVLADRDALFQVMVHLLERAYQNRFRGRPLRIEISAFRQGSRQMIAVRDNGHGLSPQEVGSLSQELPNAATRKLWPDYAITRQILLDHGGDLEVQSHESAGTSVQINLPAIRKRENPLRPKTGTHR